MSPKNITICVVVTLLVLGVSKMAAAHVPAIGTVRAYFI